MQVCFSSFRESHLLLTDSPETAHQDNRRDRNGLQTSAIFSHAVSPRLLSFHLRPKSVSIRRMARGCGTLTTLRKGIIWLFS